MEEQREASNPMELLIVVDGYALAVILLGGLLNILPASESSFIWSVRARAPNNPVIAGAEASTLISQHEPYFL